MCVFISCHLCTSCLKHHLVVRKCLLRDFSWPFNLFGKITHNPLHYEANHMPYNNDRKSPHNYNQKRVLEVLVLYHSFLLERPSGRALSKRKGSLIYQGSLLILKFLFNSNYHISQILQKINIFFLYLTNFIDLLFLIFLKWSFLWLKKARWSWPNLLCCNHICLERNVGSL